MRIDQLDFIAKAAATLAESDGLRSGSAVVLEQVVRALAAQIGFTAVRNAERGTSDIVSSSGLGAADFRRLEERLIKSRLWAMLGRSGVFIIDDLSDDPTLSFLSFGANARKLIAIPMVLHGEAAGIVAVGYAPSAASSDDAAIKLLTAIAALFSNSIRRERAASEIGRKLLEENSNLKKELREKYDFGSLIGNSGPMREVYDKTSQVARSNATVLLRGEGGTGKELIAKAIHYNSLRSKRPLYKVNCAALPENLIDSELFGEGGRKGRFELADGGTLFLDEIGGLPHSTQVRLLRLLDEREFERVGAVEPIQSNVRLITATKKDLEEAVAAGTFLADLFERLKLFTIFLPPLRERKSDILLLAEHFLAKHESEHNKSVRRISTQAIDMLTAYHFPGNVRELENVIEKALIECDTNVIDGRHLPITLQTAEASGTQGRATLASAVAAFERDLIQDTLKSTSGNIARAASVLDSTERILGYKIRKYSIEPRRFRR